MGTTMGLGKQKCPPTLIPQPMGRRFGGTSVTLDHHSEVLPHQWVTVPSFQGRYSGVSCTWWSWDPT